MSVDRSPAADEHHEEISHVPIHETESAERIPPRHVSVDAEEFAGRRVLVTGGTQGAGDPPSCGGARRGRRPRGHVRPFTASERTEPSAVCPGRPGRPARAPTLWCVRSSVSSAASTCSSTTWVARRRPAGASRRSPRAVGERAGAQPARRRTPRSRARAGHDQPGSWRRVAVTSIQRRLPLQRFDTAYAAAKAALSAYSKALSKELGPRGVRVNSIAPGWVMTSADAMVKRLAASGGTDEATARQGIMAALGGIPLGRPAWPEEARSPSSRRSSPPIGPPPSTVPST